MIERKEIKEILKAVINRLKNDPEIAAGGPCMVDNCADDPCATGLHFCNDHCTDFIGNLHFCNDCCADDPCCSDSPA